MIVVVVVVVVPAMTHAEKISNSLGAMMLLSSLLTLLLVILMNCFMITLMSSYDRLSPSKRLLSVPLALITIKIMTIEIDEKGTWGSQECD